MEYSVPPTLQLSPDCLDLLRRIFVKDPAQRLSLDAMRRHPWFLTNLPLECQVRVRTGAERGRVCDGLCTCVGEAAMPAQ